MSQSGIGALLVDDEQIDLDRTRQIVEAEGFQVWTGGHYDDAKRVFDQHRQEIDLLILDISLPGRTGVEIAQELLRQKPGLKVLFVSGHVGAEVLRREGFAASGPHFLRKPFRPEELVRSVEAVLKSEGPARWADTAEAPAKESAADEHG